MASHIGGFPIPPAGVKRGVRLKARTARGAKGSDSYYGVVQASPRARRLRGNEIVLTAGNVLTCPRPTRANTLAHSIMAGMVRYSRWLLKTLEIVGTGTAPSPRASIGSSSQLLPPTHHRQPPKASPQL